MLLPTPRNVHQTCESNYFVLLCCFRRESVRRRRTTRSAFPALTSRWESAKLLVCLLDGCLERVLTTNFNPSAWLRYLAQTAWVFLCVHELRLIPISLAVTALGNDNGESKSEPRCTSPWSVSQLCETELIHFPYSLNSLLWHHNIKYKYQNKTMVSQQYKSH